MNNGRWIGVAACASAVVSLAIALWPPSLAAQRRPEFIIQDEAREQLPLPTAMYGSIKQSPSGDVLLRTSDRWGIHRVIRSGMKFQAFSLHQIPEASSAGLELGDDFAVDSRGVVYIPGIWRAWDGNSSPVAGVFLFDASGRYVKTIRLPSALAPARIAVDDAGNILVLGIDPAYFKFQIDQCFLLHKYSPAGQAAASFSECPAGLKLRQPGDVRPGPDLARLRTDIERGHLWIQNGRIYHVLPVSRLVRVFRADGRMASEISLEPPDSTALLSRYGMMPSSADRIWRIVGVAGGRFVVEWLHAETQSPGQKHIRYLCLHDSAGRPMTSATPPPWPPSFPAFSDKEGRCYFLRLLSGERVEMVRAAVDAQ